MSDNKAGGYLSMDFDFDYVGEKLAMMRGDNDTVEYFKGKASMMNITNQWNSTIIRNFLESVESEKYTIDVDFLSDAVNIRFASVNDNEYGDDESLHTMTFVMLETSDGVYINSVDDMYFDFALLERDGFEAMFVNVYPALDYIEGLVRKFAEYC